MCICVSFFSMKYIQWNPDNSNSHGTEKMVRVIGVFYEKVLVKVNSKSARVIES